MNIRPAISQQIPGIDPEAVEPLLRHVRLGRTVRHSAQDVRSPSYAACVRIERSLLTLSRFTLARQHHQYTVRASGPPPQEHPLRRLSMAEYSVLAVVEYFGHSAPVDIARALTLHRSTVLRHLQSLEAAGLVHRDLGDDFYPFLRPLFVVTHEGRGALRLARRTRVRRLERVAARWPREVRDIVALCIEMLASELHDEVEVSELPRQLGGRGFLPKRHILWHHRRPTPAQRLYEQGMPLAQCKIRQSMFPPCAGFS